VENRPSEVHSLWRTLPIAVGEEEPPTINIWIEVLPPTSDIRGLSFRITQNNTLTDDETLEARVIADGTTYDAAGVCTNLTGYYVYLGMDDALHISNIAMLGMKYNFPWEAQTMSAYVRQTSDVGAGARLTGRVMYEQL